MANLIGRRMLDVIPVAATLNLLSGIYLYWIASTGFASAYMGSRAGITYGLGAVAALVAFTMGISIVRPSMLRAATLGKGMATASDADKPAMMAEAQAVRMRAGKAGQAVAWLLGTTTVTMSVARYL